MVCVDGLTQGHTIARSPGHWQAAAPCMCSQFVIVPHAFPETPWTPQLVRSGSKKFITAQINDSDTRVESPSVSRHRYRYETVHVFIAVVTIQSAER